MPVILRLAETHTAALTFEGVRPGKHAILDSEDLPSADGMEGVIAAALEEVGAMGDDVTLLLPPRLVHTRRVRIDVPLDGQVTHRALDRAARALEETLPEPGHAVLYRQAAGFALDGEVMSAPPPTGRSAKQLSVDVLMLSATAKSLARFERWVSKAGANLADVVTPQAALGAVAPVGQASLCVFLGAGDVVVSVVRDEVLTASGSLPRGAGDMREVLAGEGTGGAVVRDALRRVFLEPFGSEVPGSPPVDIILREIGDFASQVARSDSAPAPKRLGMAGPYAHAVRLRTALSGRLGATEIVALEPTMAQADPRLTLLDGAVAIVSGRRGLHESAQMAYAQPTANKILTWLRQHF